MITPVPLLYANDPSPPESVTEIAPLASESAYCVIDDAIVNVLLESLYVFVIPDPAVTNAFTLSSTLSLVKYKLDVPSLRSSVSLDDKFRFDPVCKFTLASALAFV